MRPLILVSLLAACGGHPLNDELLLVEDTEVAGLLSVSGSSPDDVWVVGADKQTGPAVLHFDGTDWERVDTETSGDLWWVHTLDNGTAFLGGANASVLRVSSGEVSRITTPGPGRRTVFGLWASSESDLWAVGGHAGRSGFVWHYDGTEWTELLLPLDIPRRADNELPSLLKVWGDGEGTVWVVGDRGTILRSVDGGPLEVVPSGTEARLFTVSGGGGRVVAVGDDGGQGIVLELEDDAWVNHTPAAAPLLQGLFVDDKGRAVASGATGRILTSRKLGKWDVTDDVIDVGSGSVHGMWIDPDGQVYGVGGNVLTQALSDGVLASERELPALPEPPTVDTTVLTVCPADAIDLAPGQSIAQQWNEQLLNAVRRDIPRPGVHARNLFHTSIAMWDAWAAFEPDAVGYLLDEEHTADDVLAAREVAISYAAHEVLVHRYTPANGGAMSVDCFDRFMEHLGLDPTLDDDTGDTPAALGNRIGKAVVATYFDDGANEDGNYGDPTGYTSPNAPLTVDAAGYHPAEPSVWAPLNLSVAIAQNGIIVDSGVQGYIGPHWGQVTPFALRREIEGEPYYSFDGPLFDDAEMNDWVVDVIQKTAWLDFEDGEQWDISPGAIGNNSLGANDGTGFATNPATGQPYPSNLVSRGDFGRVLAEFWADGPHSETPPGHWNTLANDITHHPDFEPRLYNDELVDMLEWDVKMYLALNGAVHDAAIAAWELKRFHESARPIALIRHKAGLGQSSDPSGTSYHEDGLPLIDGVIEVITEDSAAPGERHQHLAHFVGELAIYTWRGEPSDHNTEYGGHGWERGVEWMPYQRRTFVTPAFPGYVSGHSTFSRAAATVLAEMTGSDFFPGGLGTFTAEQDEYLVFEQGPSVDVELQWATYFDAADQAGQSRLWGGIHIFPDDGDGRMVGSEVGEQAVEEAILYFERFPDF